MHQIIVAFYALIFSLSHTGTAPQPEAPQPTTAAVVSYAPTRQELAHAEYDNSYAETACVSCRRTNVSYRTH